MCHQMEVKDACAPLVFFDTHEEGAKIVTRQGDLRCNLRVCKITCVVVNALLGVNTRVFVTAFYNAHLNMLKEELAHLLPEGVVVGTMTTMQGQEADAIVISFEGETVAGPGALCHDQRLVTVGISRASQQLVLVGSSKAMLGSPIWARVLGGGAWVRQQLLSEKAGPTVECVLWRTRADAPGNYTCTIDNLLWP